MIACFLSFEVISLTNSRSDEQDNAHAFLRRLNSGPDVTHGALYSTRGEPSTFADCDEAYS